MAEYTPMGQGTYNTVAGSIGLASAVLPGLFGGGGLFGGNNANYVSRETFDLSLSLAASQRDNAILTAELGTEKKMVEVYNALYKDIRDLEKKVDDNAAAQAVINCGMSNNIGILQTQVNQLLGMTKLGILNEALWPAPTT